MKQFFVNTAFPIWFRSKSVIRKLSTSVEAQFSNRPFFLSKNIEILRNLNHYQICKEEKKASDNHGHKIMKHSKTLVQLPFVTRKMVLDIQYKKHCMRVASRIAEQLKTQDFRKLGKIGNITKVLGDRAQYPVFLPQIKIWYQWSKITQKQISNISCPVQFCLIS